MSQFYVDLLWFREVGFTSVFWTELRTKVLLGVVFGVVFFALLYVNLLIVRRIAPTTRFLTPDQEVIERIRQAFEPYLRWLFPVGSAVLAMLVGIGVTRAVADLPAVAELQRRGRSATPSRCSIAIPPSTSSRCRGCSSSRAGCSRRSSASRC